MATSTYRGEKELGSPDKKEQPSSSPHMYSKGEMITCFFQLPCEDAVGVHVRCPLEDRKEEMGLDLNKLLLSPCGNSDSRVQATLELLEQSMNVSN